MRWLIWGLVWLFVGEVQAELPTRRVKAVSLSEGVFFWYAPSQRVERVLFVVHGSLTRNRGALSLARKFLMRWRRFARKHGLLLVAPAFDRVRYQAYGGYRGLFGRDVGADVFLERILLHLKTRFPRLKRRFYLYGHSAGGQFVIRYCVRHPHRILKAVASAPGRYAFPTKEAPWPYGMGRLRRKILYRASSFLQKVDIQPDAQGWLRATQLGLVVLVGTRDRKIQPIRPAHGGWSRVETAQRWVRAMKELAERSGQQSRIRLVFVGGAGHRSRRLTSAAMKGMLPISR